MLYNRKFLDKITSKTKIYLFVILVLLVMLCVYEHKYIIPSIIIYIILLVYTFWANGRKKDEFFKHLQELTFDVESAAKSTLINSPFPLIIIQTDGNIVWKNNKFVKEFINININTYLEDIIKEIKQDIINNDTKNIDKQIEIQNKTYKVIGEYIKNKEDKNGEKIYTTTLYFLDNTNENEITKKYQDSKTCVAIINIDNYEELAQRISEQELPQVIAAVEKEIYEWTGNIDGLTIKKDRDTFVCLFEKKYLNKIENEKFNILDTIKLIDTSEKMTITLSIAVSGEGNTNVDKYKSALSAMDIALGRGGDQAVIKKDGNFIFYGGRSQEVEKRTKVKARIIAHALEELILEAKNVMIMGHENGDIDAMGASLGMYRLAKTFGKEAYIVSQTADITLANFIEMLQNEPEYQSAIIDKNEAMAKISPETLLIVVDTHKKNYVEVPELLEETEKIVIIDHHRKSTDGIENASLVFHEVYASSAAELVIEILQYSKEDINLTDLEIEALYGGIMVDTKDFTFKTGVRTFEAAAYLRKLGVDIIKVKKIFQMDLENYNIIASIVKNTELINGTIGIAIYEEKNKNAGLICAKAADELLKISDITASFVIGNDGTKTCISGRSVGDINVQVILEKMGGGGHITVAGAQLEELSLEEAKELVIKNIREYLENE